MLRFEAPAPGLCTAARAETGVPPRIERERATPVAIDEDGVGERAGPRDGEGIGSVEGLRPDGLPTGGFFVAADILSNKAIVGCGRCLKNVVVGRHTDSGGFLAIRSLVVLIDHLRLYSHDGWIRRCWGLQ